MSIYKKCAVLVLTIIISASVQAQDRELKEERLETQKIAFVTTKLALSPDEAKLFWPIYNEYKSQHKSLKKDLRNIGLQAERMEELTEQEAGELINEMLSKEEQEILLKREYVGKLEPVIGNKKIASLFAVEREFREQVLRSVKRKMKNRRR